MRRGKEALDGVYAAMIKGPDGSYNIMVINTNLDAANVTLQFETLLGDATLYRHVYDPNNVFATDDTKLTAPDKKIIHTNKVLKDQIIPYGIAFYTTRRVCKLPLFLCYSCCNLPKAIVIAPA